MSSLLGDVIQPHKRQEPSCMRSEVCGAQGCAEQCHTDSDVMGSSITLVVLIHGRSPGGDHQLHRHHS